MLEPRVEGEQVQDIWLLTTLFHCSTDLVCLFNAFCIADAAEQSPEQARNTRGTLPLVLIQQAERQLVYRPIQPIDCVSQDLAGSPIGLDIQGSLP
jgi:hypothetical protein